MGSFAVLAGTAALTLAAARLAAGPLWLRTNELDTASRRRKRWAIVLAGLFTGSCANIVLDSSAEWGNWRCTICGETQYRGVLLGVVVSSEPSRSRFLFPSSDHGFPEWFASHVALSHEHDWQPIGCHYFPGAVADYVEFFEYGYFATLPHLADQALAMRMATRVWRASPSERRKLLKAFGQSWGPWHHYLDFEGPPPATAEFAADYQTWLAAHPEWRE